MDTLGNVFHIYNRANDRKTLFLEEENYRFFVQKMIRQISPVADILACCVMPNHFHLLIIPKHEVRPSFVLGGEVNRIMPTNELSKAMKNWLMGFSKSYNLHYGFMGSRFQQHSNAKHHDGNIKFGINYIHNNPVRANLVDSPAEWEFSSYNEHYMNEDSVHNICNLAVVRKLYRL